MFFGRVMPLFRLVNKDARGANDDQGRHSLALAQQLHASCPIQMFNHVQHQKQVVGVVFDVRQDLYGIANLNLVINLPLEVGDIVGKDFNAIDLDRVGAHPQVIVPIPQVLAQQKTILARSNSNIQDSARARVKVKDYFEDRRNGAPGTGRQPATLSCRPERPDARQSRVAFDWPNSCLPDAALPVQKF